MEKQVYVVAGRYEQATHGSIEVIQHKHRATNIDSAERLIQQLDIQTACQFCRIEIRYPNPLDKCTLRKLTSYDFWSSVKGIAETNLSEIKSLSLQGIDSQKQHHSAIASLSSLLQEQGGCQTSSCRGIAE